MGRLQGPDIGHILKRSCYRLPTVYIETGTWKGFQLQISAPHFEVVHGIELDAHWHRVSSERTAKLSNVTVTHGDTRTVLPQLLDRHRSEPVFIILDAHFCLTDPPLSKSPFPLWEELSLLRDRTQPDIISVDDVHTFGSRRKELKYHPDALEWESVTTGSLQEYLGDRIADSDEIGDSWVLWMHDDRERQRA